MTLAAEDVDAIAEAVASRVLDLLADRQTPPVSGLVDAATLARELGVSRAFVYDHASHLGAVRLGSGSKPRLRFDIAKAKAAEVTGEVGTIVPPRVARRRGRPATGKVAVLKSRPRSLAQRGGTPNDR